MSIGSWERQNNQNHFLTAFPTCMVLVCASLMNLIIILFVHLSVLTGTKWQIWNHLSVCYTHLISWIDNYLGNVSWLAKQPPLCVSIDSVWLPSRILLLPLLSLSFLARTAQSVVCWANCLALKMQCCGFDPPLSLRKREVFPLS